jgi:hypothetical protein
MCVDLLVVQYYTMVRGKVSSDQRGWRHTMLEPVSK